MPTAAIKTLGCKLNQYESEQIREQLLRLGYTVTDFAAPADLYVINSCTVTAEADRDTRKLARQARRRNPGAVVVVTGCYAEVSAEQLRALPEVDLVCGMADKLRIPELLAGAGRDCGCGKAPEGGATPALERFADHTRGLVKVQEGCNSRCSYCIIPEARGPSRSVPLPEVLSQARLLAHAHPELVLIGTHLGQYGRDLTPPVRLTDLLAELLALPALGRLRLSSIEPREVTDDLLPLLAAGGCACGGEVTAAGRLCRYLHIPLQSGCDSVLARMSRPYDAASYEALLGRLHAAQPLVGLGADVIVGFPGETDEEFARTEALLARLPLAYLHVFSYSPRHGTPAATMPGQVPPPAKAARSRALRELARRKHESFAAAMVGETLETVVQTRRADGLLAGVTDNYLQLALEGPDTLLQQLLRCEVREVRGELLLGRLAD